MIGMSGLLWGVAIALVAAFVIWVLKESIEGFVDDRVRAVERSVGEVNGNGTLVQMSERLLGMQAEQMHYFNRINERLDALERRDDPGK